MATLSLSLPRYVLAAASVCTLFTACVQDAGIAPEDRQQPAPAPEVSDEAFREDAARLERNGFVLLRDIAKCRTKENTLISPYSIHAAFGLVSLGAGGETAAQLHELLGLPEATGPYFARLEKSVAAGNADDGATVLTSNSAWMPEMETLKSAFKEASARHFDCRVENLDFGNGPAVAKTINGFVEEKTKGLIRNLVDPSAISPATRMVLVNTLYFRAKWAKAFSRDSTRDAPFACADGKTKDVPMMYAERKGLPYFEGDGVKGVVLDYASTRYKFVAILPDAEGGDLAAALDALADGRLGGWLQGAARETVRLWLPRLDIEFKTSLVPTLKSLGLVAPFDAGPGFAELSENGPLTISEVLHATKLILNEEETEAAAATGIIMTRSLAVAPKEPKLFRADRPFVGIVYDTDTKTVLFASVVNEP